MIKEKSFDFAIEIIKLYKNLTEQKKEYVMARQLLKSGTSIGANVREAEFAQSKADFVSKMSIALKEANETAYWLDLLFESNYIDKELFQHYKIKSTEILKLLISIVKSSKNN